MPSPWTLVFLLLSLIFVGELVVAMEVTTSLSTNTTSISPSLTSPTLAPTATKTVSVSLPPPESVVTETVIVLQMSPTQSEDVSLYHNTPMDAQSFTSRSNDSTPTASPSVVTISAVFEHRTYLVNADLQKQSLKSVRKEFARGLIARVFATTNVNYWVSQFGKTNANTVTRHFPDEVAGTVSIANDIKRTDLRGVATFTELTSSECLRNYTLVPVVETDSLYQLLGVDVKGIEITASLPQLHVAATQGKCFPLVSPRSVDHLLMRPDIRDVAAMNSTNETVWIPRVHGFLERNATAADSSITVPGFGVPIPNVFAVMKDSCGAPLEGFVVVRSAALVSEATAVAVGQGDAGSRIATGVTSLNIDGSGGITGMRMQKTEAHMPHSEQYNESDAVGYPHTAIPLQIPFTHVATFGELSTSLNITAIDANAELNFTFYPASVLPPPPPTETPDPSATPAPTTPAPPLAGPPIVQHWINWVTESWDPCGSVSMPIRVASLGEELPDFSSGPVTAPLGFNSTLPGDAPAQQATTTVSADLRPVDLGIHAETASARALSNDGYTIRIWTDVDAFAPELGGSNPEVGQGGRNSGDGLISFEDSAPTSTVDPDNPESKLDALNDATFVSQQNVDRFFKFSSSVDKRRAPRGFMYTVGEKNIYVYKRRRIETNAVLNGQSDYPNEDGPAIFPALTVISNNAAVASPNTMDLMGGAGFPQVAADGVSDGGIILNDTTRKLMNSSQFFYIDIVIQPSDNYFTNLHEEINLTFASSMFVAPFGTNDTSIVFDVDPFPITDATLGRRWFGLVAMFGDHINLGTLAIIRHTSSCTVDEGGALDFVLHPISIGITNDPQRYFIGAVICNASIVLCFTALYYIISRFGFEQTSNFPHLTLRISYILYPGTTLGAFACFYSNQLNPALFYVILIFACLMVLVYPVLFYLLSRKARAKWIEAEIDTTVDDRDRHLDPLLSQKEKLAIDEQEKIESLKSEATDIVRSRRQRMLSFAGDPTAAAPSAKKKKTEKESKLSLQSILAKFLTSSGRYVYMHRDHLRYRTTYQYYRGPVSYFGTVELGYSLICASCLLVPCPYNTILIITFIATHLFVLFVAHPYFSVGRNLFAMCVDMLFLAGTITYLRGEERTARTIFDSAEFFGSSLNVIGLLWAGWTSLTWLRCVQSIEDFGERKQIGCLTAVFGRIRDHLEELNGIDPDAEFEIFLQHQNQRDEGDKRRRSASRKLNRSGALIDRRGDGSLSGSTEHPIVDMDPSNDNSNILSVPQNDTEMGTVLPASGVAAAAASSSAPDGTTAANANSGEQPSGSSPRIKRRQPNPAASSSPPQNASSENDPFGDETASSAFTSSDDDAQDLISGLINNHREEKEQRRRDAWEQALDVHRRNRRGSSKLDNNSLERKPSGIDRSFRRTSTAGSLRGGQDDEEEDEEDEEAKHIREERRRVLDTWERDEAVEAISVYQKSQQEMATAYQAARERADKAAQEQEEEKLQKFQRRQRRLGVSDANTIVTRMYMTEQGVHEVRKPRPKVYKEEEKRRQAKRAVQREKKMALGLGADSFSDPEDSDDSSKGIVTAVAPGSQSPNNKSNAAGGAGGGGSDGRTQFRFGKLEKFPSKRNLVLERMRSQNVQPVKDTAYMYDVL